MKRSRYRTRYQKAAAEFGLAGAKQQPSLGWPAQSGWQRMDFDARRGAKGNCKDASLRAYTESHSEPQLEPAIADFNALSNEIAEAIQAPCPFREASEQKVSITLDAWLYDRVASYAARKNCSVSEAIRKGLAKFAFDAFPTAEEDAALRSCNASKASDAAARVSSWFSSSLRKNSLGGPDST